MMGNGIKPLFIVLVCLIPYHLVLSLQTDAPNKYEARIAQVVKQITENETLNSYAKNNAVYEADPELFSEFPCPEFPASDEVPTSVHELRPGDIKVIAAIGDSLTTGRGAGGNNIVNLLFDYRGLSWSIGGDHTYKTFPSLPNILKVYNPDLYGYSNGVGSKMPRLNVAVIGATSMDIGGQAANLIELLKSDPNVDFDNDWKLITLFIGGNDLCASCQGDFTPESFIGRVQATLDLLQDNIPKTFVNLVGIIAAENARILRKGPVCNMVHRAVCQCASYPESEEEYERITEYRLAYQKKMEELLDSGRYDQKDDFTVVMQPLYVNTSLPMKASGKIDYSFFAADCFHFAKKGQASAAIYLWNNMLQPVGSKSFGVDFRDMSNFECPSNESPFLYTRINSQAVYTGRSSKSQEETELSSDHVYGTVAIILVAFVIGGLALGVVVFRNRRKYNIYRYKYEEL